MDKFIYCYDESTKNKLTKNGYKFMNEINHKGKKAYLFINDGNKINFVDDGLEFSNRLYF